MSNKYLQSVFFINYCSGHAGFITGLDFILGITNKKTAAGLEKKKSCKRPYLVVKYGAKPLCSVPNWEREEIDDLQRNNGRRLSYEPLCPTTATHAELRGVELFLEGTQNRGTMWVYKQIFFVRIQPFVKSTHLANSQFASPRLVQPIIILQHCFGFQKNQIIKFQLAYKPSRKISGSEECENLCIYLFSS